MDSQPVKISIDYPEKLSRGLLLLKTFFGRFDVLITHTFVLFFYGIAAFFVTFIAWRAILFTGKHPKGKFEFVIAYQRWNNRVNAYLLLITDAYPPV